MSHPDQAPVGDGQDYLYRPVLPRNAVPEKVFTWIDLARNNVVDAQTDDDDGADE